MDRKKEEIINKLVFHSKCKIFITNMTQKFIVLSNFSLLILLIQLLHPPLKIQN